MKYLQMKHFRKILIFGSYCDLYQKERNIAKDKILAEKSWCFVSTGNKNCSFD